MVAASLRLRLDIKTLATRTATRLQAVFPENRAAARDPVRLGFHVWLEH
jgi:hypothetical protein